MKWVLLCYCIKIYYFRFIDGHPKFTLCYSGCDLRIIFDGCSSVYWEEIRIKINLLQGMNRWIMTGLLFAVVVIAFMLLYAQTASAAASVYTDKKQVPFSVEPTIKNGTTLVQLRPLFESLGIELDWNASSKTVTGTKGASTFSLTIGQRTATVNGKKIELEVPGKLSNGHTLVPLRFVGEATSAIVGWHAETRTISIFSSEYIEILGITRNEAQKQADAGVTWETKASDNSLRGFYVHSSADLTGYKGCRGMCWDYIYFINDHQLVKNMPQGGWDTVDCKKDTCLSYSVKDGQLIIDDYKTYNLKLSDKGLYLNGDHYFKHEPLHRLKLDGKYSASSYGGGTLGVGFSSTSTMIFRPDGTFLDDYWIGVMSSGSDVSGDGTGVSFTLQDESEAAGTYTIINYSILLEFKDGTKEVYMFFLPDRNERMLKIGGRDFLIDESYNPGPLPKTTDNSDGSAEPYKDRLVTDNIAVKKNIRQELPNSIDEEGGIAITLDGYQWAELDISPDHISSFTNFGDGTIVAITARYTVANSSSSDVDLSTLESVITVDAGYLPSSPSLTPKFDPVLKPGGSVELLAVFIAPADLLAKDWDKYPELVFSGLKTTTGDDALGDNEIEFSIHNPYR